MSNFFLPHGSPFSGTLVQIPHILNPKDLLAFRPFTDWLATLSKSFALQTSNPAHPFHSSPYRLHSINIQAVDFFRPLPGSTKPRIGFLKLQADISNTKHESLPGGVFMRGGSVAMLIVITRTDDADSAPNAVDPAPAAATATAAITSSSSSSSSKKRKAEVQDPSQDQADEYVVLTVQPRVAAGSLLFVELPAGMIDDAGSFAGAAAREIKEETGIDIKEGDLIDLTKLASESASVAAAATVTAPENDGSSGSKEGGDGGQGSTDNGNHENVVQQQSETLFLRDALYASPGGSDEFIPVLATRKVLSHKQIQELQNKTTGLKEEDEKISLRLVKLKDLWKVGAKDAKTVAAWGLWEGLKREGKI